MAKRDIDELMASMPQEEKITQLCGVMLKDLLEDGKLSVKKCRELYPRGFGHLCQFACTTTLLPDQLKQAVVQLQEYQRSVSQSKIPVLIHDEAITGVAARGAAITPQMIGMSCSWNPQIVRENARLTAENMAKLGCRYCLSPMMDIITDARWGRAEEGYGEDSYLVASFVLSFILGMRDGGAHATAKHFAGYGVENQDMAFLRNETLYPFEVAVKKGKVSSIMPGYHAFRGVPCSMSELLLHDILRGEWGFEGLVVSDYGAIQQVYSTYRAAQSDLDGAAACLRAGTDVDFPSGDSYRHLKKALENGKITEEDLDRALRRVLQLKQSAGLLEEEDAAAEQAVHVDLDPPRYRQQCRKSAQQAVVMLKNDGTLPLKKDVKKIAVIGPNADSYYSVSGDYTWNGIAEYFHRYHGDRENPHLVTLLEGIRNRFGNQAEITFERGFDWTGKCADGLQKNSMGDQRALGSEKYPLEEIPVTNWNRALQLARESDVILAAVGENRFLCGENCNRDDVRLPGDQESYVRRLCETGRPVVLVVFGGRPMAIADLAERCAAVLYAWYPGEEGGNALADLISGDVSPSGKLTVTLPESNEQVPVFYQQGRRAWENRYPFGFGLTYSEFAYSDLKVPARAAAEDEYFDLEFTVRNTGNTDAAEIAQFYLAVPEQDTKRLAGFVRAELRAGEAKRYRVRCRTDFLAKYDAQGKLFLSGADYRVQIGASAADIRLEAALSLQGETRMLREKTHFFTENTEIQTMR